MKKALKTIVLLLLFIIVFPSLAGFAVMALWNSLIPAICGFATITFLQGVGLFFLGQLLTGGFLLALFLIGGGIHTLWHRNGAWNNHWHNMTDEQRREFITRRRREHFGFRNRQNKNEDATE